MRVSRAAVWILFLFFGVLKAAMSQEVNQSDTFPSAEAVAEAFRFPISKLRVTNASEEASKKYEGHSAEAWVFTSTEKVFASVNAVLTDGGVILTEKIKTQFETILASARPDQKAPVLRMQVGDATGYAGVAGFGPGGAALAVTLYLPAQNQDLQIVVNIPFMDRTDVAEDLSDYVRLFSGDGGDMLQSLIHISSNAVQIVAARAPVHHPPEPERARLPVTPSVTTATTPNVASQGAIQTLTPPTPSSNALSPTPSAAVTSQERSSSLFWWAITAAVALGLSWALLRRRQR
jgi:hypothetical protein